MAADASAMKIQGPDVIGLPVPIAPFLPGSQGTNRSYVKANGNGAASAINISLPADATRTTFIQGVWIRGLGSTAGGPATFTITGLAGGTMTFALEVPAGATIEMNPVLILFPEPLPGSAINTAVGLTVNSFGAGNTDVRATIWGFQQ